MSTLFLKKLVARLILIACLLSLVPARAGAWGIEGHRIVARIASHHLTKRTQAAINKILSLDKNDPKQCRNIKSLEEKLACVSTWADEAKTPATGPFHFTDIPLDGGQFNAQRDCPAKGCSISALDNFRNDLRNSKTDPAQRAIALKFIVHLIGDLHQPLHNAQDRDRDFNSVENTTQNHDKLKGDGSSDIGGNAKPVKWFEEVTTPFGCFNLHTVWDEGIIEHVNPDDASYASKLDMAFNPKTKAAEIAQIQSGDIVAWANEALQLAIDHAYKLPAPEATDAVCEVEVIVGKGKNAKRKKVCTPYDPTTCKAFEVHHRYHLGETYFEENQPVVEGQLGRGGLRLARVLNAILDPKSVK